MKEHRDQLHTDLLSSVLGPIEDQRKWMRYGSCLKVDPEIFSPPAEVKRGERTLFEKQCVERDAKKVCAGCAVIYQCREYALSNRNLPGVWGGLTEGERKNILDKRKRPGA